MDSRRDPGGYRLIAAERTGTQGANFRVLLVCTANQCRSPMAEHLLRRASAAMGLNWSVESAGVLAHSGRPMHRHVNHALRTRSIVADGWTSRRLSRPMIEQADLVLAAAAEHRRAVVLLDPSAVQRTFLLLQFARFAALAQPIPVDVPAQVGGELLDRVAKVRGEQQPVGQDEDDLPDPMGKPARAFQACLDQIQTAIDSMLRPVEWSSAPRPSR